MNNITQLPLKVKGEQLQLADVVQVYSDMPFSTCIVKKIEKDQVILFRPYGVTADFSYTGGVICYTGVEEFPIWFSTEVTLLERKYLR